MNDTHVQEMGISGTRHLTVDIMESYGDSVYKFCRSLTRDKEAADDLFQDTFLLAYTKLAKIEASDSPQGVLIAMAVHLWKSRQRKLARRWRLAPTEPLHDAIAEPGAIDDAYMEREDAYLVQNIVNTLPEKLRIPVLLYYSVEWPVQDIAAAMKLPPGTVKSRLFKARELIKKGLEAAHYEP